jgi:hypothetical protein
MSEAFAACLRSASGRCAPKKMRAVIAGRIIAAASIGERDPARLRAVAATFELSAWAGVADWM